MVRHCGRSDDPSLSRRGPPQAWPTLSDRNRASRERRTRRHPRGLAKGRGTLATDASAHTSTSAKISRLASPERRQASESYWTLNGTTPSDRWSTVLPLGLIIAKVKTSLCSARFSLYFRLQYILSMLPRRSSYLTVTRTSPVTSPVRGMSGRSSLL